MLKPAEQFIIVNCIQFMDLLEEQSAARDQDFKSSENNFDTVIFTLSTNGLVISHVDKYSPLLSIMTENLKQVYLAQSLISQFHRLNSDPHNEN